MVRGGLGWWIGTAQEGSTFLLSLNSKLLCKHTKLWTLDCQAMLITKNHQSAI